MAFHRFFSILVAWRLLFTAVFVAVLIPAVVVSLLIPKRYTAVASVVVDLKPDQLSSIHQSMRDPGLIATQIDIIQSDRVARRVVRTLKLAENAQIRERWQNDTKGVGDIETWWVNRSTKELDVKPSRESSVINVAYHAASPRLAAGMANAFLQAYIETALELRVDPAKQYSAFFDVQVKEARDGLEKAQALLTDFQRENGLVMTDERLDIENQRLNELSSQLVTLQSTAAEATSRQAEANAGSADKMQEITGNSVVASLRADMLRSEARLKEINSRLGDNHPQVQELRANIAEMRERINSEIKRLSAGVGVSSNISRQRVAQTRTELDLQRTKMLRMKQVRDAGLLIFRDVENAQRAYDGVVQRFKQTSLESQATLSNVSMLSFAVPPLEHSFPKLFLNAFLGLVVGLLLATGIVLGAELRDRRIRHIEDVEVLLGLPVFGILPGPASKAADEKKRAGVAKQGLSSRSASPKKAA